jgi:7-cyano-7-deazaguanine synthase
MKVAVLHSGGIDSTVALAMLRKGGHEVHPVAFVPQYGPVREPVRNPVAAIWGSMGLTGRVEPIPNRWLAAMDDDSPYVPNRNMVLLALAGAYAISEHLHGVAIGSVKGDVHPDGTHRFLDGMEIALRFSSAGGLVLHTPAIAMTKAEVIRAGADLGAPLALTWSCYKIVSPDESHCGDCPACVRRSAAFVEAGVADPTTYCRKEERQCNT